MKNDPGKVQVPPDLMFGAVVQAVKEVLHESGVVDEILQAARTSQQLQVLKDGLLTYQQAATLMQVSFRTFKRMMEQEQFPKIEALGRKEPRVHISGLLAVLLADGAPKPGAAKKTGRGKITELLYPARGKQMANAA